MTVSNSVLRIANESTLRYWIDRERLIRTADAEEKNNVTWSLPDQDAMSTHPLRVEPLA
jgi:hypothetical protein